MLGFNKPKKLIADLDRVHFFGLEEPEQLEVLDQVNSYTTSRSKLNKLVDAGLLSKLANLLAGVQSAKMLPIPQHKLMELLTQFAKLEEIQIKLGVGAHLCEILMHEIEGLVDTVDALISNTAKVSLKANRDRINLIRKIEKKKETLQPHKFKITFSDAGPLGIELSLIDPKDVKKGVCIKALPSTGLGAKENLIKIGDKVIGYNNKVFSNQTAAKVQKVISKARRPIIIEFEGKRYGKEIKNIDNTLIQRREAKKNSKIRDDLVSKGKDLDKIAKKKEKKKGEPYEYECNFIKGSLGIKLRSRRKDGRGAVVDGIVAGSQAEAMGGIHPGHKILAVNDLDVRNEYVQELKRSLGLQIKKMKKTDELRIRFEGLDRIYPPGFEYDHTFQAGSIGLELAARDPLRKNGAIIYKIVPGSQAENSGKCRESHQIIEVAGTQCLNKTLKEIKTLLVTSPRPVNIKFQVRDFEKEEKDRKAREFDQKKREDEALAKKRAPVKTLTFEKGPHGIYLEKIPGNVRGVRILKTARNSTAAEHKDVYIGLEIVSINGEDFTKRMLKPAEKKMAKLEFPWSIVVRDPWLQHFSDGMKMEVAKGEHRIIWSEKNGALDFSIKPNPNGSFGCVVGALKEEIKNGFAAIKGLKADWPVLRINDVDLSKMTMSQINDVFSKAKVKRPLSITFMIMTDEQLKDIAAKASKKRIAGIATKLGKKKLNLRGLLWSMAPKPRKEQALPNNAEIALQMIPEYCKVLYALCANSTCTDAACSEEAFFAIAKGLRIFLKCKSRVEKEVRGALLKLSRLLIDSSRGIERFLDTPKLVDEWLNILFAEEAILPIYDLSYVLHKVTLAPGTTDREDFSSIYVFRVGINKLNDTGPKMLKAKEEEAQEGLYFISSVCLHIIQIQKFVEPLMNSYIKPPGLAGLWILLAKTRKLKCIAVITELVAAVNLNESNKLFALQSKVPTAATVPPFNALHVLVMSMHRTGMQNKQTVFEYEVTFEAGPMGLLLDKVPGQRVGVLVHGIRDESQADDLEVIEEGDILAAIGDTDATKYNTARALSMIKSAPRPLRLKFHKPNVSSEDPRKVAEFECKFNSGPMGIRVDSIAGSETGAIVTGIDPNSQAAKFPRLTPNDRIIQVAGKDVENDAIGVIMRKLTVAKRPVSVTFRDPNPRSQEDVLADRNLVSATRLLGAILHYQSSPGAMAIRLAQRRKNVLKGDVGKKVGNKLFKRFKAKKEGKDALEDETAEEKLKKQKISLDHPLDGLMMVDDALVLTDLVFKRLLKTPHPSFELAFHLFDVVELITCIDPVKIGELSIPGFLHMATLEEESTTLTYAAHVLEVVTGSMARQAEKYGQYFCEKLVLEGTTVMGIRSFNRIEESLDELESKPLIAGDIHVLKWNETVCMLLCTIGSIESEQISVFFKESGEELIPNLYYISDIVRRVSRIETENLDALMEQGDFDGDGVIDDYEMVKDIEDAKSRVNILRKIEGLLYEAIFRFCKNNVSCREELTDISFIPTTINALQSMATLETPIGAQALVALSRLLLLLTFDEDRLDPLLSDKGAVASIRSFCSVFTRVLTSSDDDWKDYGGVCIPTQNIAQVSGQILRLIDIDIVLDRHGGQPLCRPLAFRVKQLIRRILQVNDIQYKQDKISCILALVIILYEMASINNNRVMLVDIGAPEALCDIMDTMSYPKNVMVSAAGALFNITCSKAASLQMQATHPDSVLLRLVKCIQERVEGPHCQSLLIAALRNIVSGTRQSTLKAAAACRHIIPTFQIYLGEAAHVSGLHTIVGLNKVFTNEDEDFLPSLATEVLQCMKFITHVKILDLKGMWERVLNARNIFPAGLMSVDTLSELHKRRRTTYDEDIRIIEADDTPIEEVFNILRSWYDKAISKGFDDTRVRAYINRKAKERGEKFYNIFLSKRLLFDSYGHIEFDEYDAQATVARPDNSVNIVKWVDFEYYGEKMKEDGVVEKHKKALWVQSHEGYDIETMPEEMQKQVRKVKKSHYIDAISTSSTLEIHKTNEVELQAQLALDSVDALYNLDLEIKEKQKRERSVIRQSLLDLRATADGGANIGQPIMKSSLAKLGLNLMNSDFYGGKLSAHSPENFKKYTKHFNTTIAPNNQENDGAGGGMEHAISGKRGRMNYSTYASTF